MALVELDDILQRFDGRLRPKPSEVRCHVRLELVLKYRRFRRSRLIDDRQIFGIYQRCSRFFYYVERSLHERIDIFMELKKIAGNSDLRTLKSILLEELGEIVRSMPFAFGGDRILRIDAGKDAQQDRRVANGTRHWSGCIL